MILRKSGGLNLQFLVAGDGSASRDRTNHDPVVGMPTGVRSLSSSPAGLFRFSLEAENDGATFPPGQANRLFLS